MADSPREARPIEEREFVILLISLYRDSPELWKAKHKDYGNKYKKRLAITKIINILKTHKPDFDEDKLKKKINVLRTNFNKEYQRIEQKKRSGAYSDEIPEPTLWYFKEFLFIKDQSDVAESETSEQSLTEETPRRVARPIMKKKKTTPGSTQELTNLAISYFKKSDNEADIIAKGWAIKLRRLAPDQRLYAEKIINDTLFEAEMGTLSRSSTCYIASSGPSISNALSVSPSM